MKTALIVHGERLVNESDSECHEDVVIDSDEISEVGLMGEIDELYEASEVDYDEVIEIEEADE